MPVPELRHTFAWLTSEIALGRLARKYSVLGREMPDVPQVSPDAGLAADSEWTQADSEVLGPCVISLGEAPDQRLVAWANLLADDVLGAGAAFTPFADKLRHDLVLAGSSIAPVLLRECTEQAVRVQLAAGSKTVQNGPFYSEYLPAETILSAALTLRGRNDAAGNQAALRELLHGRLLQIGGDETLGKGLTWGRLVEAQPSRAEAS
jgi:CRISPR-associated protein Cmr4